MKSSTPGAGEVALGRILFAAALLVYGLTLSPGFFPGVSAAFVSAHLGIHPFPPLVNHVWGWLIHLLAALPFGELAFRIHGVGALCSAVSVWLLFRIMLMITLPRTFSLGVPKTVLERVRVFSALVAALVLGTATPFWLVATRAHPLAFDLMLLLLAFHQLFRFRASGNLSTLYLSVLIYAVGLTDFATLVVFLPLYVLLVLLYLYLSQRLRPAVLLRIAGLALLGLTPQFIAALLYMRSEAYVWREFSHYGQVLWYMWRDQYLLVLRSLPRVGWLTVAMVSFVPWAAVYLLGIGRKSPSAGAWLGTGILCALFAGLGVVVLADVVISPWAMTRENPLLVTPYLLIAMWVGAIAGYWCAAVLRADTKFLRTAGNALAFLILAGLVALGFRNSRLAGGHAGHWFDAYAGEVVDRLDGRTWLVSGGALDDLILLKARERGLSLKAVNLRAGATPAYRRYVASLFDDLRLKSLAAVNLQPLLMEWFAGNTNVASEVAVVDLADLWIAARLETEPNGPVYRGREPERRSDPAELMAANRAYWNRFAEPLAAVALPDGHPAQIWFRILLAQAAKSANNTGVWLEDAGEPALAEEAYRAAARLDAHNISALLNLMTLCQRDGRAEAAEIEARVAEMVSLERVRHFLWSLSYHQGTIRSPELYAGRGWAWALSGKPALAAQDLQKAIDLGGDSAALRMALAALDSDPGEAGSPEALLQQKLERDPNDADALMGLYRMAVRRGQFDVARLRLDALRRLKVPEDTLRLESALLDLLTGKPEQAKAQLADAVRKQPDDLRAWAALAVVAGEQNDAQTVQESLDRLQQAQRASPAIRYMAALVALRQGDRDAARRQFEQVLRQEPRHAPALEAVVRLLMAEGDRQTAETYVDRLIAADPRHPFGNYMLGAFQAMRGQYALAETSYRVSLGARRSPEALNDLAYVLARQQRVAEALPIIEECLRLSDLSGAAYSTYGMILLADDRLDEAETALRKALEFSPEAAEVQLNLAQLYERRGRISEALRLAEAIMSRSSVLLRDDQDALRELLRRLRNAR